MPDLAEHDQRVMELVVQALGRKAAERECWLRSVCGDDRELFDEAIETIRGEERMGSFLLHPAIAMAGVLQPLEPGQTLAGRFEILRAIGEGGMGVVYEAFDRKRGLRIAIKAAKPGFHRLLSPELEGALAVRHVNICRVNEIHTAQTSAGDFDFLTMELLEGRTLAVVLEERGCLPSKEALNVVRQLCAGLGEAHRHGVVHRDLKPANIFLCPEPNGGKRLVITDFGLAGASLEPGALAGTPNYMAPEVWLGQNATPASDIYALGVILYQLTVCPRLTASDPIPAPSRLRTLPRNYRKTIRRCLAGNPLLRPVSPGLVISMLDSRPRRRLLALVLPLVMLVGLLIPSVRWRVMETIAPPPPVRLVILPPQTPDTSLSNGMLDDVTSRLNTRPSSTRSIVIVGAASVRAAGISSLEQARLAHATHVLETDFARDGQDLLVQASVLDTSSKRTIQKFSARYSPSAIALLPGALTGFVCNALHLPGVPPAPVSAAALPPYDRGLYLLGDDRDVSGAIEAFKEAAQIDPRSTRPIGDLADAEIRQYQISRDARFLDLARKSISAGERIDPDSMVIHLASGMLAEATGQYEKAREEYLRASQIDPSDLHSQISLALIDDKLSLFDQTDAIYRKAIARDPNYYEPYEFLGNSLYNRGSYDAAIENLEKAIALAPGLLHAYTNLSSALFISGHYQEAEKVLRTSLAVGSSAPGLNNLGAILLHEKKYDEAAASFAKAEKIDPGKFLYSLNLGDAYRLEGRASDAAASYRRAMHRALNDLAVDPRHAYDRAMVGYLAARLDQKDRAIEEISQALALEPSNNRVIYRAVLTYETLRMRDRALASLKNASPQLYGEIDRDPDLADISHDSRYLQLEAQTRKENHSHA